MSVDHYTYRVTWSREDEEYLGLCVELTSLSWLATTPVEALSGIHQVAAEAVADMQSNGELVPEPLAESGKEAAVILASSEKLNGRQPLVLFLKELGLDKIERERDPGAEAVR